MVALAVALGVEDRLLSNPPEFPLDEEGQPLGACRVDVYLEITAFGYPTGELSQDGGQILGLIDVGAQLIEGAANLAHHLPHISPQFADFVGERGPLG